MTLHISQIDTDALARQLALAYACPHGKTAITKMIEQEPNRHTKERLQGFFEEQKDTYDSHSLISMFTKLAAPHIDLTEDKENYVADLVIPWTINDGFVRVALDGMAWDELTGFVGDYSQDVYACSYNEDDVRNTWNQGRLRYDYESYKSCIDPLANSQLRYNDYDNYVTFMVKLYNFWPTDYGHMSMARPSNLTEKERARVDAFDAVAYIKRQYTQIERID